MKTIYLARHAQTESNAGTKISINEQIAVTELGKTQAVELSEWFLQSVGQIDGIFVSAYQRTYQTALPLLTKLNKIPVVIDGLHEFNYLNFSNICDKDFLTIKTIADNYWLTFTPDEIDGVELDTPANYQAESFAGFVGRVKRVIEYLKNLPDGTYVVYTHGMWLSMLMWISLNQPTDNNLAMQNFRQFELSIRPKNCEVFCLKFVEGLLAIKKVRGLKD